MVRLNIFELDGSMCRLHLAEDRGLWYSVREWDGPTAVEVDVLNAEGVQVVKVGVIGMEAAKLVVDSVAEHYESHKESCGAEVDFRTESVWSIQHKKMLTVDQRDYGFVEGELDFRLKIFSHKPEASKALRARAYFFDFRKEGPLPLDGAFEDTSLARCIGSRIADAVLGRRI